MIQTFLLFIPAFFCLFWVLIHVLFASRVRTFETVVLFLLVLTVYLITGSCFAAPTTSPVVQAQMFILTQLTSPCLVPLFLMYNEKLRGRAHTRAGLMFWLLAPAALFTASLLIYLTAGADAMAGYVTSYYERGLSWASTYGEGPLYYVYLINGLLYNVIIGVEILILIVYLIQTYRRGKFSWRHLLDFAFRGGKVSPLELSWHTVLPLLTIFLLRTFTPRSFVESHFALTFLFAIAICLLVGLFSYFALFSSALRVSIWDMKGAFRFNVSSDDQLDINAEYVSAPVVPDTTQEQGRLSLKDELFSPDRLFPEDDSLRARFQHLMVDEQLFLHPGLTLGDVAERLHSNKTYVSKLVNTTYNIGLPELLNTLRVDYAEQYILSHSSARQDEIARACGFHSASSFNNIFKKVTGVTPKVWEASFKETVKQES